MGHKTGVGSGLTRYEKVSRYNKERDLTDEV